MRLLVAWDGSDGAQAALRQAQALAGAGGQIDVVQILDPLMDAADVQAPSTREAMAIVTGCNPASWARRRYSCVDASVLSFKKRAAIRR